MKRAIVILTMFAVLALFVAAVVPAWSANGCGAGKCAMSAQQCPMGKTGAKASGTCPKTGKACEMKKSGQCPYMKGAKPGACPMGKAKAAAKKSVSAVCPVMGSKIPDVSKAAGKSVYKGKTYYFCCAGCKPKFDKNPEQYVKKAVKK